MAVSLRDEDVQALATALRHGRVEVDALLATLQGSAVEGIHRGLEGTQTAVAFDQNITEFIAGLNAVMPRLDELGAFITQYLADFHAADQAQAAALR